MAEPVIDFEFPKSSPELSVACELIRVGMTKVLHRGGLHFVADRVRVEIQPECHPLSREGERFGLMLTSFVLAMGRETKEFCWPETWWDHFKLRFFSARMKRRWPVRYHVERVTIYDKVCPHMSIATEPNSLHNNDIHIRWLGGWGADGNS